jgi:Dyp-type peroxidase family
MAPSAVSGSTPPLELDDIQGLVARGYGNLRAASFLLISIEDAGGASRWLEWLVESITSGSARPKDHSLNVAFTAPGLAKLGLDASVENGFSSEFAEGITTPHRRRLLGDVDSNAPEAWAWGGPGTPAVDVLLLLYATDAPELDTLRALHVARLTAEGMSDLATLATRELDPFEHFGFHDGISQPIIEGLSKTGPWADTLRAGEFILGYPNEYGLYTTRPFVSSSMDPKGLLPAHSTQSGSHDLGRNGSYLVLRQLRQYVHRFWRYVDSATKRMSGANDPAAHTRLAAKMVGRWPSGAPLVLAPEADDERLSDANDFGYHETDPHGFRCPIGSHVRRANPRDSLEPEPGSRRSIGIGKRHRILRRGRVYGPRIDIQTALASDEDLGEERGLHFMCLNTNIARQFEFVQHTWINDPKFNGLYVDPDPLGGATLRTEPAFTVQGTPLRTRLRGVPEFTSMRGGGYFFLPGIRAIRYLANIGS